MNDNTVANTVSAEKEVRTYPIPRKWRRISRDYGFPASWSQQQKGEDQAMRDLEKPIEQLLSDIHETDQAIKEQFEAGKCDPRDPAVLTIRALAGTASMAARLARRTETLTCVLIWLTGVLVALTAAIVWLTVLLLRHPSP